jgi:mannose-1-phosphate guanylyltransferase
VTEPWPALVLAAGFGTRVRPLSLVRAKPALPVAGTPLAGRILRTLAAGGVRDAVLNLHYRPDSITRAVGDGAAFGVRVRYSWEREILGSAGGPCRALPLLGTPRFLIANGDTLSDVDLAALWQAHAASGAQVTMAVIPNRDPGRYGGVLVDDDGLVTGFTGRGWRGPTWHFVGIQAVEAAVFRPLDPDRPASTVGGVYDGLIARERGSVRAFRGHGRFRDIGTVADYLDTCRAVAREEGLAGIPAGRGTRIDPAARIEDSVLWDDVSIGPGAVLEHCVVGDAVTIPAGARFAGQAIVAAACGEPGPSDTIAGDLLISPIDGPGSAGAEEERES